MTEYEPKVGVNYANEGTYRNEEWMKKRFAEGMLVEEIADMCNVTSNTINRWRNQHGIERHHRHKPWLENRFYERLETVEEVADILDLSPATIREYAQEFEFRWKIYHRKNFLEEKLIKEDMTMEELADELDVRYQTIQRWASKVHDLNTTRTKKWHDKEYLAEKMFGEGLRPFEIDEDLKIGENQPGPGNGSMSSKYLNEYFGVNSPYKHKQWLKEVLEIGWTIPRIRNFIGKEENSGPTYKTIINQIREFGFESKIEEPDKHKIKWLNARFDNYEKIQRRLDKNYSLRYWLNERYDTENWPTIPNYVTKKSGYVLVNEFGIHRLLAIAEYGFDKVVGNHVHHKSVTWDNRPETIEVMTPSEHISFHRNQQELPESEQLRNKEQYVHEPPREPNPKHIQKDWLQTNLLRYDIDKVAEIAEVTTEEIEKWSKYHNIKQYEDPFR